MKTIIHNTENGKVAITNIVDDLLTHEYCKKYLNDDQHYKVILNSNELPDTYFQEAWKFENFELSIDVDKAKQIQIDKFRRARDPILKKLDVEFMRAVESGDKKLQRTIAAKKQELRDITSMELSNDLTEIKTTWPDILNQ
jgi:hypothetical protein